MCFMSIPTITHFNAKKLNSCEAFAISLSRIDYNGFEMIGSFGELIKRTDDGYFQWYNFVRSISMSLHILAILQRFFHSILIFFPTMGTLKQ